VILGEADNSPSTPRQDAGDGQGDSGAEIGDEDEELDILMDGQEGYAVELERENGESKKKKGKKGGKDGKKAAKQAKRGKKGKKAPKSPITGKEKNRVEDDLILPCSF